MGGFDVINGKIHDIFYDAIQEAHLFTDQARHRLSANERVKLSQAGARLPDAGKFPEEVWSYPSIAENEESPKVAVLSPSDEAGCLPDTEQACLESSSTSARA